MNKELGMRFQIILPTYNASRWFESALKSVASHPQGEVLVIDDGSWDAEREKIAEICCQYEGVRFFAEPHRGIVGTLNFGLSIATAPYIARMDADDISLPGRFDKQIAFLDSHSDVAVVGGQMIGIDSAGQLNGKSTRFPISPEAIAAYLAKGKNPFMHPSVMMRRDAVLAIGGYRPATEYAEDYDLWLRLAEHYPLANLPEPLINYRRHNAQITRSVNWKQKFARDLAALSASRRRADKIDPVDTIPTPINRMNYDTHLDEDIVHLIHAYNALESKEKQNYVSNDTINWILSSIDVGLMGRSSKSQAKAAARATKFALKNANIILAFQALRKGIALNPIACIREL